MIYDDFSAHVSYRIDSTIFTGLPQASAHFVSSLYFGTTLHHS